jgi:hypothetical protein
MVWGITRLGKWVDGGGVFDKAVIEEALGVAVWHSPRWSPSSCRASTGPLWILYALGSTQQGQAFVGIY